jgi:hypothetical protein
MIQISRRSFIGTLALAASAAAAPRHQHLGSEEDQFLEDLSHRCFLFFWQQANPDTGLVRDRALADVATPDRRTHASSAATGFGLTGLCIAAERCWIPFTAARDRVLATLRFYAEESDSEHGWFYHFVDSDTGARRGTTELSSIDTALLLAGVVTAQQYFHKDQDITRKPHAPLDALEAGNRFLAALLGSSL